MSRLGKTLTALGLAIVMVSGLFGGPTAGIVHAGSGAPGVYLKLKDASKKDGKAKVAKTSLYIKGYRIPYMLEDGGEYYIPYHYISGQKFGQGKEFYNIAWKSVWKPGKVVGAIKSKGGGETPAGKKLYLIDKVKYIKLTDLFTYWQFDLKAVGDKSYMYTGRKPTKKELKLKKDIFYDYAVKITKGKKSVKAKIKAIHDAIVLKCSYDKDGSDKITTANDSGALYIKNNYQSLQAVYMNKSMSKKWCIDEIDAQAYHMLKDKTGLCSNYADLFKVLCERVGINCDVVTGKGNGVNHAWNRVYVGNKSYHLDCTWDDPLNNNYRKASDIRGIYYMKTANFFMGSHTWSGKDYKLPKFSKSWGNIARNNIKSDDELRKAAVYASYEYSKGGSSSVVLSVTGKGISGNISDYILNYGYAKNVKLGIVGNSLFIYFS